MNITALKKDPGFALLHLEDDLVAARIPKVRSDLRDLIASGHNRVTLDLSGTQMVDSAGLGLLISAHNSLKKAGGGLTVIHASKDVLELFHTMRIHQHFSVSGS
jgi:anti-anti-sigma factor